MKILFVGGGTLGHIYPSFPVIKLLKNDGWDIYFISGKRENELAVLNRNKDITKVYSIDMQGFKRRVKEVKYNIETIKKYCEAKKEIRKIIETVNPLVVVGLGGYVSAPALKVAIKKKIKTIINEQNSVYGMTNRLLKNKVNKVLLSYENDSNTNAITIGNPRTSEFYNNYYHIVKGKKLYRKNVLVVGGSIGATKINDLIIENYFNFKKKNIEVTLITGKKYYSENQELIDKYNHYPLKIIPFTNSLYEYLIDAKIVVSRSGATTISEIFGLKKPSILIPSPNVTNNHQYKNALYYHEKGCCHIVLEEEMESKLINKIEEIISDEEEINRIINNIDKWVKFDSDRLFYQEIIELVGDSSG